MKILSVRFKNMNTLQGEWALHFDRSPFKESGLFAITGPNGSGKSTIFDAISLGMYGEVVRHQNTSKQIISNQAADGYSTVTFSVNGSVFRSTWSLASTADNAMTPEMRLVELSDGEQLLQQGVVNVRDRVAQLTGLDFKRFSRAVMLAQGEFAAFLNALDNERMDILENIVGKNIYASVIEDTAENLKTAEQRIIELREKIQNVTLLDASTVARLQETAQQLEQDLQATERSLARWQRKQQQLTAMEQQKNEYDENKTGLAHAENLKKQRHDDFLRLEKAAAAAPYREALEALAREKKRESENVTMLDLLKSDIAEKKSRLDNLDALYEHLALELNHEQKIWSERLAAIAGALEMDRALKEKNDLIKSLAAQRSSIDDELKRKQAQRLTLRQQLSENEVSLDKTESWLIKHASEQGLTDKILEIKHKLEALQSIRHHVTANVAQQKTIQKAKRNASRLFKKNKRKLEKCRKTAQKNEQHLLHLQQVLNELLSGDSLAAMDEQMAQQKKRKKNCRDMLKIAKAFVKQGLSEDEASAAELKAVEKRHAELQELLQQEKSAHAKIYNIARFEPCRKQLQLNHPCPLCGSPDHPYVDREPPFAKNAEEILRQQEEKLSLIERQIEACVKQMTGIKRQHEGLAEIRQKWDFLCEATGIQCRVGDLTGVLEGIEAIKRDRKILRKRRRAVRRQNKSLKKHHLSLQKMLDDLAEKQLLFDKLQQDLDGHEERLALLKKEIKADRQREEALVKQLRQSIEAFDQTMPKPGREANIVDRLEAKRMEYINHQERRAELSEQALLLADSKQKLTTEIERLEQEAKAIDEQIHIKKDAVKSLKTERETAFGPGDALAEQQDTEKRLQQKKEQLAATKQEIEQISRQLSDQEERQPAIENALADIRHGCKDIETQLLAEIEPVGFATLEELESSLLSAEQQRSLEQEKASIDHAIEQFAHNLEKIRKKLGIEDPEETVAAAEDDLLQHVQDDRKRKDELAHELSLVMDRLQRHQTSTQMHDRLLQELEQQEKVRDRFYEEKCFFETAEDTEIRTRVREMMLERLLEHSNRHLEALSGRYYLRRRAANGLELEIEDAFQGRHRRPVNTLSGGEGFLVSIAMALGLSDMSGNGRKIESLFIDEGFGYLDDETLYNVLATLKNLQNNRKTVGIISHIKMLENEIPTKIRISKLAGGVSRLDVVA